MTVVRCIPPFAILALVLASGCGTLPDGRSWGGEATCLPGWRQLGRSATRAALDPQTWGPLAAAALLQIDDADHELSDWAREHTPLFGSPEAAQDAQGWTGEALDDSLYATLLLTPGGDTPGAWTLNKLRGGAVEFAALGASGLTVDGLKDAAGRTRPAGDNDKSFPSSHAARSSADVTLAARNLDATPMPASVRWTAKAGLYGLGAASAWSRVEAGSHYPSDALAGWAVGHFWGPFIHDAFLWRGEPPVLLLLTPEPGGARLALQMSF